MMRTRHLLLGASVLSLAMASCESPLQSCTEMGCGQGEISVEFVFREPGTYRFQVDVDGARIECTGTLPLDETGGCNREGIMLVASGSMLPPEEQSLGPLVIRGERVGHVEVRAYRDEQPAGTSAFDVTYTESPGPNGPGCDPEVCVAASGGTLQ